MGGKAGKGRMVHYDLLRIFAAFSVVMLHSSARFWYEYEVTSQEWLVANTYDALFRFGVPIFVMLSGAIFLSQEYKLDIKKLYTHNILRLVSVYIVWSCIYGLLDCCSFDLSQIGWKDIVREMIFGRYHLWFLPMITGFYMLLPILRVWVQNGGKRNLLYFLTLFFVLQVLSNTLRVLWPSDELAYLLDQTKIEMACGYMGYFVLGYYITHVGIPKRYHKAIYLGVVPAGVLNVVLGNLLAIRAGEPQGEIYNSFGLFTFWIAVAIFLFFIQIMGSRDYSNGGSAVIREISMGTMGIYVMHVGMMEIMKGKGLYLTGIPGFVEIPLTAVFCFMVCLGLSSLLRRIPFVGRYIC